MSSSTRTTLIILLICVLAAGHIWWLSFICDDAFISFRYAKNLIEGNGLVFNVGERVEGYTNFLWLLVSAAILGIGGRPEVWSLWIGAVLAIAAVVLGMRTLRSAGRDDLVFGLLVATNGGVAAWATGGLETTLFTLLILGAFLSCDAAVRGNVGSLTRTLWLSSGLLILAALTRPEGVLVTAFIGLFLLVYAARGRVKPIALGAFALHFLIVYGAYFVWRWQYFGEFLPHTFQVKATGLELVPLGLRYLLTAVTRFHLYLALLPMIAMLCWRRPTEIHKETGLLAGFVLIPYTTYVCLVGGDFMDMSRFFVPILPVLFYIAAQAWRPFHVYLAGYFNPRTARVTTGALIVILVGLNLHTSWDSQKVWHRHGQDSIGMLRSYSEDWRLVAEHLRTVSQPTDKIATTAAGIIPYYTGLYTIDQFGIVAGNLDSYRKLPVARPGHSLLIRSNELIAMRPRFILGHPQVSSDPSRVRVNFQIEEEAADLLNRHYQTTGVQLGNNPPRYVAYAVRKDRAGSQSPR